MYEISVSNSVVCASVWGCERGFEVLVSRSHKQIPERQSFTRRQDRSKHDLSFWCTQNRQENWEQIVRWLWSPVIDEFLLRCLTSGFWGLRIFLFLFFLPRSKAGLTEVVQSVGKIERKGDISFSHQTGFNQWGVCNLAKSRFWG